MPKPPILNARTLARALQRAGFTLQRQTGSHAIYERGDWDRVFLVSLVLIMVGIAVGLIGRFISWTYGYDILLASGRLGLIVGLLPKSQRST